MANIVFLGNFEVPYSSENHHANSLESLGHTVCRLQERFIKDAVVLEQAIKSDLFIWVHTHGWNTPGRMGMGMVLEQLKASKVPTMTYHLDLWLGLEREKDLMEDNFYQTIGHFLLQIN